MIEHSAPVRGSWPRRGPVEPLSPQAWQRVESAVFAHLDAAAVPWSLAPAPLYSYAAARPDRSLRLHWGTSVGLALVSAVAAASVLHLMRPPSLEAGPPAELVMPAQPAPEAAALDAEPPVMEPPPSSVLDSAIQAPSASVRALSSTPHERHLARSAGRRQPPERGAARSGRERLFERAASLESANAPLALALYLSLASGADDWAANALYAAARLELDRGLHEASAGHLSEYLSRFPRGENTVDVAALRQRMETSAR